MIVNAGIKRVVADIEYLDNTFKDLFLDANIKFFTLHLENLIIAQVR
jgi:dCMP deaminase